MLYPRQDYRSLVSIKARIKLLPSLPDVPMLAEILPGFESVAWYGIVAPPRTPKAIVDKINADVNAVLEEPEVWDRLSAEIYGGAVAKTAKYMREEVDRWDSVINAAHIKIQ